MHGCVPGFNGERRDAVSGTTHLGNGYRAYNPILMRFNCPDGWSPFGAGGINPYAYCAGDPVNRADPSGHHSFWGWLGIGAGVVLGVLMTPVSGGTSLTATMSAVAVAMAVVSTGLAVAQQFLEARDPNTAIALGWAALGTGIVSGLTSVALSGIAPGARSLVSLLKGTSNRPFGMMMMSGGGVIDESAAGDIAGAAASGQFRYPRFIGIYPSEENEGAYMALSFIDRFEGHDRLNIVGTAHMRGNSLMMGSGRWTENGYQRTYFGYTRIANLVSSELDQSPDIRILRLAVPYATRSFAGQSSFRAIVARTVRLGGMDLDVTAPLAEFSVDGPAADAIERVMAGVQQDGRYTAEGQEFNPTRAQNFLSQLSQHYANTPNAFNIRFDPI